MSCEKIVELVSGYDVIGITLQLFNYGEAVARPGACCAGQDIYDAKRVADTKGFPHYVLDYEDRFREDVMEDFADTYLAGETPIPCIRCNQTVKFRDLIKRAKELEADVLATGHYVQNIFGAKKIELHRGSNELKDQSYFLHSVNSKALAKSNIPLGNLNKTKVREIAKSEGLITSEKKDSTGICFIGERPFPEFLNNYISHNPGKIEDEFGKQIGEHKGLPFYTLGQRQGLGIGGLKDSKDSPWEAVISGASLLQLYSALVFNGPTIVSSIVKGLKGRVKESGFSSIGEAVGSKHI